jgi:large subunit ribosomal protein L13
MSVKSYTSSYKVKESERNWHLIDASDVVLGRLASFVAVVLRGKNKPSYTPHNDCGDHVVVVNAEKIHLTGDKLKSKVYYRHSVYTGGLKERTSREVLTSKFPGKHIENAVSHMIPRGPLGRQVIRKLHVYHGPEHPHAGQNPVTLNFADLNKKNSKRK